jgi:hypothetical protein
MAALPPQAGMWVKSLDLMVFYTCTACVPWSML